MTTNTAPRTFGRFLRNAREKLSLSLREAAESIGVSDSYLSSMELGHPKTPPSEQVIRAAARVYRLDVDALFCAAGRMPAHLGRWVLSDEKRLRALRKRAAVKAR